MNIRMKDESRTCRIPAERRKSGIDRSLRRFPRCELFHFTLSPFAEWKPSTSHPSNPRLHASASNFIHHNYAARCPLSPSSSPSPLPPRPPGYLHRDLTLFHSSKSTCTDYILAGNVHRLVVLLNARHSRFRISANKLIDRDLVVQSVISHGTIIIEQTGRIIR